MTEITIIPLFIVALTFPLATMLPALTHILRTLRDIDTRLSRIEGKGKRQWPPSAKT